MKKQSFQFLLKITSIFDKTWRLLLSIRRFYHIPHSPNNGDFRLKSRFPIKSSELVYISSSVRFITPCLHAKSSAFFHIFSILRFSLHFTLITVSMVTHKSRLWRHTAGSCAWMVTFKRVLLSLSVTACSSGYGRNAVYLDWHTRLVPVACSMCYLRNIIDGQSAYAFPVLFFNFRVFMQFSSLAYFPENDIVQYHLRERSFL